MWSLFSYLTRCVNKVCEHRVCVCVGGWQSPSAETMCVCVCRRCYCWTTCSLNNPNNTATALTFFLYRPTVYIGHQCRSLSMFSCRQLFMKAKTRTQRCAECCWHMRSCAGENECIKSNSSSLFLFFSFLSYPLLSSNIQYFVSLQEVPTNHLSVPNTFLILSP